MDTKDPISARVFAVSLLAILLLALLLRLPGLLSGLPYSSYVDEGHVLLRVMHLLRERTWDPVWYNYPSLTMYFISAAIMVASGVNFLFAGQWISVPENIGQFYGFIAPAEVLVVGRITMLLFGLGAVGLVARLASRLAGRGAGLLAGISAAITPALVTRGGFVMVDTVAAFFLIASLNAALEVERRQNDKILWAFICGLFAGWAFTAKYPSGAVILSLLPVIAFLPVSWREKVGLTFASGIALCLGMVTGMPALVFRTGEVVHAIGVEVSKYSHKVSAHNYFSEGLRWEEVGWFFPFLAFAGVSLLVWHRKDRASALGWILMAGAFLFPLLRSSFQPIRNLEPLFVLGCVAVGVLPWVAPFSRRTRPVATSLVLAGICVSPIKTLPTWAAKSLRLIDSRTIAVDWIAAHAQAGERILISREIVLVPSEVSRIPGEVEVVDRARVVAELRAAKPVDWIMAGKFAPPYARKPKKMAELQAFERMTEGYRCWTFGRRPIPPSHNLWYGNQPRIKIYQLGPTNRPTAAKRLHPGWAASKPSF